MPAQKSDRAASKARPRGVLASISPVRASAARLLLRTLTDEFAFRRISRIDVGVLPTQIEHHWQDIAASSPPLRCADYLAVTKAHAADNRLRLLSDLARLAGRKVCTKLPRTSDQRAWPHPAASVSILRPIARNMFPRLNGGAASVGSQSPHGGGHGSNCGLNLWLSRGPDHPGIPAFRSPSLRRSNCRRYFWLVRFSGTGARLRKLPTVTSGWYF